MKKFFIGVTVLLFLFSCSGLTTDVGKAESPLNFNREDELAQCTEFVDQCAQQLTILSIKYSNAVNSNAMLRNRLENCEFKKRWTKNDLTTD